MSAKIQILSIEETHSWEKEKYGDYKCRIQMSNGEDSTICFYINQEDTAAIIKVCANIISEALTLKSEELKNDLLESVNKTLVIECEKEGEND